MNAKKQAGTAPVQAAALPEATKTDKPTVLHPDVFKWYEGDGVAFLCENGVSRIYAATDAVQTITSMLLQREVDTECEDDNRLVLDTRTVTGLLHAVATCTSVVQQLVTGGTAPWSQRIGAGEEAQHLQRTAVQAAHRLDQRCAKLVSGNAGGAQ